MKRWALHRESTREPETVPAATGGWVFGPVDAAISAGMLILTVAVCVPVALSFREQAKAYDRQREDALDRSRQIKATLEFVESRRTAHTQLRRAADRYVAEVQARPIVPWATVVGEMSRRRPGGLWAVRMSGDGPRFRVEVSAQQPQLVSTYAQSLRESPYVDFAALPTGVQPTQARQVVGRMTGD